MDINIFNPRVLFVRFENQGGDWVVRIPKAHKDGSDFVVPIEEELSLQFQPVALSSLIQESVIGVGCIPLRFEADEEGDSNANPAPTS